MKKLVLFAVSFACFLGASAQINVNDDGRIWMPDPNSVNDDVNANAKTSKMSGHQYTGEKALGERVLGVTTYDLQTNYSVHDRIVRNSSGDMSVVRIASEGSGQFADRGTG